MAGGRLLEFKDYIGGSDNVQVIEMFPYTQKSFTYNFGFDVSGYTFSSDVQSILLDEVTYDRTTGDPNFTSTNVIGYFDNFANIIGSINDTAAASGYVTFTIPQYRYKDQVSGDKGWMYPNAREKVVMTVVSFQWETDDGQSDLHRWAIIERWEPGVTVGDPTDINNPVTYTAI